MAQSKFVLKANCDWPAAAQSLINGIASLSSSSERIDLLEIICEQLGDELYPSFLHILFQIEASANEEAKQLVAATLVDCLLSGRLPSGKQNAWGSAGNAGSGLNHSSQLGPIEFLCAWQVQGGGGNSLSNAQFVDALTSLIRLTNSSEKAASLYIRKLNFEANDTVSGSFSGATRRGFLALSKAWADNKPDNQFAEIFLAAAKPQGSLSQLAKNANDFL